MKTDNKQTSIFDTARILIKEKGMSYQDAIAEIEGILHIKLPEFITDKLREESNRW